MFKLCRNSLLKAFSKPTFSLYKMRYASLSFMSNTIRDIQTKKEPFTAHHKGMEDIFSPFNQGLIHYNEGKYAEALQFFKKAKKQFGKDLPQDVIYFNMALCYQGMHNHLDAIECYEKSFEAAAKDMDNKYETIGTILSEFVNLCLSHGKYEIAFDALNHYLERSKSDSFNSAIGHWLFGRLHLKREEYDLASAQLQKALDIYDKVGGHKDSNFYGMLSIDFGNTLQHLDQVDRAVGFIKEGVDVLMSAKDKNYNDLRDGLMLLSQVYYKQTKYDLALDACEKAKGLLKVKKYDLDLQE